jgi:hypothetical protein
MLVIGLPGVTGEGLVGELGECVEVLDLLTEIGDGAGSEMQTVIAFYDEFGG